MAESKSETENVEGDVVMLVGYVVGVAVMALFATAGMEVQHSTRASFIGTVSALLIVTIGVLVGCLSVPVPKHVYSKIND